MQHYIWLFPLLFIFHDLEEIIGFIPWIKKQESLLREKAALFLKIHQGIATEGFALAVLEEFLLVLMLSLLALLSDSRLLYLIWLGGFMAFALHLVCHIVQAIQLRSYIPALATSIICLPISLLLILQVIFLLKVSLLELLFFSLLGLLIVLANLLLALKIARIYSKWLSKYGG